MATSTETETKVKILYRCNLHPRCQVGFDDPAGCPVCDIVLSLECAHAEIRAGLGWYNSQVARLKMAIKHHSDALRGATATITEQDEQIGALKTENQMLSNLLLSASKHAEHVTEIAHLREEVELEAHVIRERDGTIETYREQFRIMTEKIEELTPDCETCSSLPCPDCEEDDLPYEEPQQPEDMGARHGLEVTPRTWGKETGS